MQTTRSGSRPRSSGAIEERFDGMHDVEVAAARSFSIGVMSKPP